MTAAPACRFGDRCSLETYEDAVTCLGEHSDRTRTEIAKGAARLLPGKSEHYLRTALSVNDGTHNIQLAAAPAFYHASGNPALLTWHARACGFGVHRLPTANDSARDVLIALTDVAVAHGDVAKAAAVALADRKITQQEAAEITARARRTIDELMDVIVAANYAVEPSR